MKKLLRIIGYIYISGLVLFAFFLIYAWTVDYKPDDKTLLYYSENPDLISDTSTISLLTWNTGYFGQDNGFKNNLKSEKVDDKVKIKILNNSEGIKKIILNHQNTDFILLQEVDINSKRSSDLNQYRFISELLPGRTGTFALNYNVFFVPSPLNSPTGKIESGLMSISKYIPSSSVRHSFPPDENFPSNLFNYDRCILVNKYKLSNDKELVIVNIQPSDQSDIEQIKRENTFLSQFLKTEYDKGNYIVAGGDWNQTPPEFKHTFTIDKLNPKITSYLKFNELKNWKYIYDSKTPTSRTTEIVYKKGQTFTSVTDFFLISPNIQLISIKNINTGFEHSSHELVNILLKLK